MPGEETLPPAAGFALAALPFDPSFDDVFYVAMAPAAQALGMSCVRIDQLSHANDAVAETHNRLAGSAVVLADVTGARPNVMYEVGYALALGKPVIQLRAQGSDELPFLVRNRDTLEYLPGGTYHLMPVLRQYLSVIMARTRNLD